MCGRLLLTAYQPNQTNPTQQLPANFSTPLQHGTAPWSEEFASHFSRFQSSVSTVGGRRMDGHGGRREGPSWLTYPKGAGPVFEAILIYK